MPIQDLSETTEENKRAELLSLNYQKDDLNRLIAKQKEKMATAYTDELADIVHENADKRKAIVAKIAELQATIDETPKQRAGLLGKTVGELLRNRDDEELRERVKSLIAENVERIECKFLHHKKGSGIFAAHLMAIFKYSDQPREIDIIVERATVRIIDRQADETKHASLLDADTFLVVKDRKALERRLGKKEAAKMISGLQAIEV